MFRACIFFLLQPIRFLLLVQTVNCRWNWRVGGLHLGTRPRERSSPTHQQYSILHSFFNTLQTPDSPWKNTMQQYNPNSQPFKFTKPLANASILILLYLLSCSRRDTRLSEIIQPAGDWKFEATWNQPWTFSYLFILLQVTWTVMWT